MSPSIPANNTLTLVSCPHPFSSERLQVELPAGPSLADFVRAAGVREGVPAHVWVGEQYVPRERWHRAYPRPGAHVTIRAVPCGGGGEGGSKDTMRVVAMIAVVAMAAWAGPAAVGLMQYGLFGSAAATSAAITAAVGIAGNLAVNALIPPPTPKADSAPGLSLDRGYAITGSRNRLLPFGVIPRVFGRIRFYPPMAALPYTEAEGDKQFYRMLFAFYGPAEVSELRIGETPLEHYQGVEYEIRQGHPDDEPVTLYTNDVFEETLSVLLEQSDAAWGSSTIATWSSATTYFPGDVVKLAFKVTRVFICISQNTNVYPTDDSTNSYWVQFDIPSALVNGDDAEWVQRTSQVGAQELSVDLVAPGGLVYLRRESRKGQVRIGFIVEYAPTGTNDWTRPVFAGVNGSGSALAPGVIVFQGVDGGTLRLGLRWMVAEGQYDVRIKRVVTSAGLDSQDTFSVDSLIDTVYWAALRSVRQINPVQMSGLCQIALRIQATDQLNGVLDQVSCVAQALLPVWDGAAWSAPQATRWPAWAFAEVRCGAANRRRRPYARLNAAELKAWADWCEANGITYDAVIDSRTTVGQLNCDIAAVGFASPARRDGLYTVVRDVEQAAPAQHFTPRNSWGFRGSKRFTTAPHALRMRYLNEAVGWQQDEVIVYADGFDEGSATEFEEMELFGVSSALQAWKTGRYHQAVAKLRPETYELWADVEHLVCARGALVRVAHDVALWGSHWGRIQAIEDQAVTLDEAALVEAGKTYGLRARTSAGDSILRAVVTPPPGEYRTLELVGDLSALAPGDLAMFGETDRESVELLVKAIYPAADFIARIELVDAAPGVHQAWTGEVPDFESQITMPIAREQLPPPTPVIEAIVSDESVLVRSATGIAARIVVSYRVPAVSLIPVRGVQCQYRRSGLDQSWSSLPEAPERAGSFSIVGVVDGEAYDVRLHAVSPWGVISAAVTATHTVVGKSSPPADVAGFTLQITGGRAIATWSAHPDLDVVVGGAIIIRHSRKIVDAAWNDGLDIGGQIAGASTSANLPALPGTYMARALDSGGRLSLAAALVVTAAPNLTNYNVVETLAEAPAFAGNKTDVEVVASALRLTESAGAAAASGVYEFESVLDLGAVYVSRVWGALKVEGYEVSDTIASRGPVSTWPLVSGAVVSDVTAVLEIATTDDDPADSPAWSAWRPVLGTEVQSRAIKARLTMTSPDPNHNALVSECSLTVDMPDRALAGRAVVSDAAGTHIAFAPTFKATPAIGITAQDMATGDYFTITNKAADGFDIRFFNASGAGISRTFDWQALGYGSAG